MDANPTPGAVPAFAGIDKPSSFEPTLNKPPASENVPSLSGPPAESKPFGASIGAPAPAPPAAPPSETAKPSEPAGASTAIELPKPVSVEDVPDKDGPTTAAAPPLGSAAGDKPAAEKPPSFTPPAAAATTATAPPPTTEPVKESVEQPADAKLSTTSLQEESIVDKPAPVNGTAPSGDVEMTGALKESRPEETTATAPTTASAPAPAPIPAAAPVSESKPTAPSEESEAVPKAAEPPVTKPDDKPQTKPEAPVEAPAAPAAPVEDKKRKADVLDADSSVNVDSNAGLNGAGAGAAAPASTVNEGPAEKKRKPGRPAGKANGTEEKKKESLGHKVARKAKNVLAPIGRTQRKTRSQGPVEG